MRRAGTAAQAWPELLVMQVQYRIPYPDPTIGPAHLLITLDSAGWDGERVAMVVLS